MDLKTLLYDRIADSDISACLKEAGNKNTAELFESNGELRQKICYGIGPVRRNKIKEILHRKGYMFPLKPVINHAGLTMEGDHMEFDELPEPLSWLARHCQLGNFFSLVHGKLVLKDEKTIERIIDDRINLVITHRWPVTNKTFMEMKGEISAEDWKQFLGMLRKIVTWVNKE